jgi:hypothetical protein
LIIWGFFELIHFCEQREVPYRNDDDATYRRYPKFQKLKRSATAPPTDDFEIKATVFPRFVAPRHTARTQQFGAVWEISSGMKSEGGKEGWG